MEHTKNIRDEDKRKLKDCKNTGGVWIVNNFY